MFVHIKICFACDYFLGTAKALPWRLKHDQFWGIRAQEKFYLQIRILLFELSKNAW